MTKRIVVLLPSGENYELEKPPSWSDMAVIIGGDIEHVRVLDRVTPGGQFLFTSMFVHEEGLLQSLPRNPAATEIYQRNVRAQFGDNPNPFAAATEAWRKQYPPGTPSFDATPEDAVAAGYHDDPWIAGPAIFFEGYTVDEVDDAITAARG